MGSSVEGPQPPWQDWGGGAKQRPLAITDASTFLAKGISNSWKPGTGSEALPSVQQLILYARRNPSLQKLVDNYEAWERNYRWAMDGSLQVW